MTVPAEGRGAGRLVGAGLGLLLALGILAVFMIDEPLRQWAERTMNDHVPGYHLTIGSLRLHPLSLSVDLHGVELRQNKHPEHPLATIPTLTADARFAPLLTGTLDVDIRLETPIFHATDRHLDGLVRRAHNEHIKKTVSGWQDRAREWPAFRASLHLGKGQLTYEETRSTSGPIQIQELNLDVTDLTNRPSAQDSYPSQWRAAARLPDESHMEFEGQADFLATPSPAVEANMKVHRLQIANLFPILGRYNFHCRDGTLDLAGRVNHSGGATSVAIDELLLEAAKIDYVHAAATKRAEMRRAKQAADKAVAIHRDPLMRVSVEHGKILDSEIGFVNKAASPDYRVYMTGMNVELEHFSNRFDDGVGVVRVTGQFMGSGPTVATGRFRPEKPDPDFDLNVRIVKTRVETFNDVLRAHGGLDTARGTFAFFSELAVKEGRIQGYVKPLLKDVEVYDPTQDQDKAVTKRIYEAVVGEVLGLLKNRPRDEVVTVTDMSGRVDNPKADTWQIVGTLVQNAFFKAILPGFEQRIG